MTAYFDECCRAMAWLSEQPNSIFLGQAVRYEGTAIFRTLKDVPMEKRIEFPVAENMQLGASTGLALSGLLPISIFPRINFLLEATSQLVSHLDKLPLYSDGGYVPKVIIRTAVGHNEPLDPGEQHLDPDDSYAYALSKMLRTVRVLTVRVAEHVMPAYEEAVKRSGSTLIVEYLKNYD